MLANRRRFISSCVATVGTSAGCIAALAEQPLAISSKVTGYDYQLPDLEQGSRLLFQGDSITDMKWGRNQDDRNHYLGHSYVFLIAGRLGVELANSKLDVYNRGMSGHTVADLRKRWQQDAIDIKPDLLSILIGTNDAGRGVLPQDYESDFRYILDQSRKANSKLRIVLLEPFVLRSGKLQDEQAWAARRSATDKLGAVVARLAKDYDAVHVETQKLFDNVASDVSPEHWIWDGVHPLPQGHELIARSWIQQVSRRWPKS